MRRFWLAAMMCGVAAGAQAADLSDLPVLRGAFTEGLSANKVNWQGYYVGGQADWGSITSKIPARINSDLQGAFIPPTGIGYNWIGLGQATASTTALARSPDTIRSGKTSLSASRPTTCTARFAPPPDRLG